MIWPNTNPASAKPASGTRHRKSSRRSTADVRSGPDAARDQDIASGEQLQDQQDSWTCTAVARACVHEFRHSVVATDMCLGCKNSLCTGMVSRSCEVTPELGMVARCEMPKAELILFPRSAKRNSFVQTDRSVNARGMGSCWSAWALSPVTCSSTRNWEWCGTAPARFKSNISTEA